MRAKVQITDPDSVEVTVSITLPVSAWRSLLGQLPASAYPSWQLVTVIRSLINQAEKQVSEPFEVEP